MSRHLFWKSGTRKSILPLNEEREFERNVRKLENLDENSRKLYKDVKAYIESNTATSKAARKASQDFLSSPLCQQDEELTLDIEKWDQANTKTEQQTADLNMICQKAVVEPIKKLNSVFPSLQAAIKKREQSLQEYTRCQQKVEKVQDRERTGANIVKMETSKKALQTGKEEFYTHNNALAQDMPRFYSERIGYIRPCLEALVRSQVLRESETFKIYAEVSSLMENKVEYSDSIQNKLTQVKALSITVDD